MTRCDRTIVAFLVSSVLLLAGCGGGTSQDDMRRYAIRRTPATEEEPADITVDSDDVAKEVTSPIATPSPTESASQTHESTANAGDMPLSNDARPHALSPDGKSALNKDGVPIQNDAIPSLVQPAEPLPLVERRERTASNLKSVGEAWRAYLTEKEYFPGPITSVTKQPLLSWRVELLPYLGLQSLYDLFHLDEAWDSPHNSTLLSKIPAVFQSPERFDTKTNYLAISLSGTTVYQERRKVTTGNVEDGVENTLALVEVDDEQATPWTQPMEYSLTPATPLLSLGKLRGNGLFVVWSDGKATWIDGSVDPQLFAKACTIDAGDGFLAIQIANELATGIAIPADPEAEVSRTEMVETPSISEVAETTPTTAASQRPTLSDAQAALKSNKVGLTDSLSQKKPIPAGAELKISRDLLRELFQTDYAAATSTAQRVQLARKMLERLSDLGTDTAGQYALLEITKQIAIQAGDVEVALNAAEHLLSRFELEGDHLLETFEKLARTANDQRALNRLLEEAGDFFDGLVSDEQFAAAERLSQLGVATANKLKDQAAIDKFTSRRSWASAANSLSKSADEGLVALEANPDDPRASGGVGKFLCLVKGDWENGLVILANGNDRSLKRLADMELSDVKDAMQQLELADLWWRESETELPAFKMILQSRAKYWYERSLSGLPAGLVRIRVERRIEEIDKQSA